MVRALAFHKCGLGSNSGVHAIICELSVLLGLFLAPGEGGRGGGSPGNPVFPSPLKPTFPNSNSIWDARTRSNEFCFLK